MKTTAARVRFSVLALCLPLPATAAGDVWAELSKKGDLKIKLGSDDDGILVASTAFFSGAVKLNGAKGTDTQTLAPTTILNAKTKGIEVFEVDATADVIPEDIAAAMSAEYVARGGDPADIPCP